MNYLELNKYKILYYNVVVYTDRSRMNPSTKAEQNSQGGRMSKYSKEMKKKYGLDKND